MKDDIHNRLCGRWLERMLEENALPICVIGITQGTGPDAGVPVLLTTDNCPVNEKLADLFLKISVMVRNFVNENPR